MPVEEHEVGFACVVDHLVDPDQPLDCSSAAALLDRVEIEDADDLPLWRCLLLERPATYPPIPRIPTGLGLG
jgi:hypothetical protein